MLAQSRQNVTLLSGQCRWLAIRTRQRIWPCDVCRGILGRALLVDMGTALGG